MDISVGDKVQLINGAVDISTGRSIKTGQPYCLGSSSWATVSLILDNYKTGTIYGSNPTITKVQLTDNNTVVWQGDINDIAPNIIYASNQSIVQTRVIETTVELPQTESGKNDLTISSNSGTTQTYQTMSSKKENKS